MSASAIQSAANRPGLRWYQCRSRWWILLALVVVGSLLVFRAIQRIETIESVGSLGAYRDKSKWDEFIATHDRRPIDDPWHPRSNKLRYGFDCPVLADGYELALPAGATDATLAGTDLGRANPLRTLRLSYTDVTDAGLDSLHSLHKLRALNLAGTRVTDTGLSKLKHMTELQWLNLGGLEITDAGVEHLKALPRLQWLSLRGTRVTDTATEHLKELKQLQSLELSGSKVTPECVAELQEALPKCKIELSLPRPARH